MKGLLVLTVMGCVLGLAGCGAKRATSYTVEAAAEAVGEVDAREAAAQAAALTTPAARIRATAWANSWLSGCTATAWVRSPWVTGTVAPVSEFWPKVVRKWRSAPSLGSTPARKPNRRA